MTVKMNPATEEDLSRATGRGEKWGEIVTEFVSSGLDIVELEFDGDEKPLTVAGGIRAYIAAHEDVDARVVTRKDGQGGDRVFLRTGRPQTRK